MRKIREAICWFLTRHGQRGYKYGSGGSVKIRCLLCGKKLGNL